ncbi:hypothetical protein ZIOFF_058938 [Zingiber officinale]|uniref:Cryptochrome C-terminal domain-containing protein n=1 Tax=Zingiber officinale TaxID=94328 RepID=A0A8J5F4B1_ZINOF|nr:hypothetical protein ZIOFF_058938 [Zingiber officinale]
MLIDIESDALGWQYISGILPDGCHLDRIILMDLLKATNVIRMENTRGAGSRSSQGYRLNGYTIHWAHLILYSKLQELNNWTQLPFPIVEIDAAKARLQEALAEIRLPSALSPPPLVGFDDTTVLASTIHCVGRHSLISTALSTGFKTSRTAEYVVEDGSHSEQKVEAAGLLDSLETFDFAFTLHLLKSILGPRIAVTMRRYQDQMVPSLTSSLVQVEEEELSIASSHASSDSRAGVPSPITNSELQSQREARDVTRQLISPIGLDHDEHSMGHSRNTHKKLGYCTSIIAALIGL